MAAKENLLRLSAVEALELMRAGDLTAAALTDAYLEQIDRGSGAAGSRRS